MNIGFTGTRSGMTPAQLYRLEQEIVNLFLTWPNEHFVFHHGDCVGADAQLHELVKDRKNNSVVVHPPELSTLRAFCSGSNVEVKPPKRYLDRNLDIVRETTILFVCPKGFKEDHRSGTWSTFRRAQALGRTVIIIGPDGGIG